MYSNIIKIKNVDRTKFGTGLVIAPTLVLTAEHVVSEQESTTIEYKNKEFNGHIVFKNTWISLIQINDKEFSELFLQDENNLYYTNQEIILGQNDWEIQGFVTEELSPHTINGTGVFKVTSSKEKCDFEVGGIAAGKLNNYQGMSGSPVILNGRAVGVVQIQTLDSCGMLGIGFTYIDTIIKDLPQESILESGYVMALLDESKKHCRNEIDKNIKSAKYIPEIFVEQNEYKEDLRYFADPVLFIQKAVEDLKSIDFSEVNKYFGENFVDFSEFSNKFSLESFEDEYKALSAEVKRIIQKLDEAETEIYSGGTASFEERYKHKAAFNNALKWELKRIKEQISFVEKRFLLLTKGAGQGKTNLLCDFTENFILRKGIPCFYFNASKFVEKPSREIISSLTVNSEWHLEYVKAALEKMWRTSGRFVVIIVDGLNENTVLNDFGKYMEETINELRSFPYLKIIMTTRCELFDERFGMLTENDLGDEFSKIEMTNVNEDRFKRRIFNGYLSFFNVEIREDTLSSRIYEQLANDTLLLRFFCEVNRGKKQVYMYNIYKYSLFEKYHNQKKIEIKEKIKMDGDLLFERLIDDICEYMVSNETFNQIPKNELIIDDISIANYLLESDVIFKEDLVIKRGFEKVPTATLSFTFDEFRDYCLTKYLLHRKDASTLFPQIWEKMHENKWSIIEGIEKYVFYLSRTKIKEIKPIIESSDNYYDIYWANIWDIEEEDLQKDDIDKWRDQFFNDGEYVTRTAAFLLKRRNKTYYKRTSIDLLFLILNDLAECPSRFDNIINKLFPIKVVDKYNQEIRNKDKAIYCDRIIQLIENGIDEADTSYDYTDLLRLTVYAHQIMPIQINEIWGKAYQLIPKQVTDVLERFQAINRKSLYVIQNMNDIIESLLKDNPELHIYLIPEDESEKGEYLKAIEGLDIIWANGGQNELCSEL